MVQEIKIWPFYQMVHTQNRIRPREFFLLDSNERPPAKTGSKNSQGVKLNEFGLVLVWFGFIIFNNPSARAGYDTRSIFKWS